MGKAHNCYDVLSLMFYHYVRIHFICGILLNPVRTGKDQRERILFLESQAVYSLSGSSWSGGSSHEGWDWRESAGPQSPQMHCSLRTQKSRGLRTGSTPWWSQCRWMQLGPKSSKKIGNTSTCIFSTHLWTCMPAVWTEQYTAAGFSSAEGSVTDRNTASLIGRNREQSEWKVKFLRKQWRPLHCYTETSQAWCSPSRPFGPPEEGRKAVSLQRVSILFTVGKETLSSLS